MWKEHQRIEDIIYTGTLVSWHIACHGGHQVEVAKKAATYDDYDEFYFLPSLLFVTINTGGKGEHTDIVHCCPMLPVLQWHPSIFNE
eukprot:9370612-Ditylum_brightwellii.AAC.1